MLNTLLYFFAACFVAVVAASFFEWLLHRYVMHRPILGFRYPFKAHALVHHHVFRADDTYHLHDEKDGELVPMAWWNGPILVAISQIPFLIPAFLLHRWSIVAGSTLAVAAYYATYEYLHWCMHVPRARNVERSGVFFRLNGHHLLHHRYMNKNFNVVFPLADYFLGTLLPRSKVSFAQARGPAVPCVQPRQAHRPAPVEEFAGK